MMEGDTPITRKLFEAIVRDWYGWYQGVQFEQGEIVKPRDFLRNVVGDKDFPALSPTLDAWMREALRKASQPAE